MISRRSITTYSLRRESRSDVTLGVWKAVEKGDGLPPANTCLASRRLEHYDRLAAARGSQGDTGFGMTHARVNLTIA